MLPFLLLLGASPPPPALQADWDIAHYDIALELDPDQRRLQGEIGIEALARTDAPGDLLLHAGAPTIASIEVEGEAAAWTRSRDELLVTMPAGLRAGAVVDLRVLYEASGTTDAFAPGLHWGEPIYSFSEPEGAREWLVVYDAPADKATLSWHITVPGGLVALANGELVGHTDHEDGSRTWDFEFPWPIATYLMVVNAGGFREARDESGPVPVYTWALSSSYSTAVRALASTPELLAFLSERFGPYPYSLYGNAVVPFGGALEHTTRTSFGEQLLWDEGYAELVNVHELGHQWWGDWVTCAEWEEIWLNEGFASYTEALWAEYAWDGLQDYVEAQREEYLAWKQHEGEFALYDPDYMWGGTVYDKGSLVLNMLRFVLGDEAFFAGLSAYGDAHAHDVATTEDLREAMEQSAGMDLAWFFDEWVYRAGDPSFRVGLSQRALEDGTWQVDVHVEQTGAETWAMPVEWTIELQDGGAVEALEWVEGRETVVSACLPEPAVGLDFSPDGHLLYEDLEVDLDGFEPAPLVCGEPAGDTGDTGVEPDSGGDSGDGPEEPGRSCGCAAPGGAPLPAALLALGGLPWLARRRR